MNADYERNFYRFKLEKQGRDYEMELYQLYFVLAANMCLEGLDWPERVYFDLTERKQ